MCVAHFDFENSIFKVFKHNVCWKENHVLFSRRLPKMSIWKFIKQQLNNTTCRTCMCISKAFVVLCLCLWGDVRCGVRHFHDSWHLWQFQTHLGKLKNARRSNWKWVFRTFWKVNMVETWDFHLTETVSYETSVCVCATQQFPTILFVWHVPNQFIWIFDAFKHIKVDTGTIIYYQDIMILEWPMFRTFLFWVGFGQLLVLSTTWSGRSWMFQPSFTLSTVFWLLRLLVSLFHTFSIAACGDLGLLEVCPVPFAYWSW